MQSIENVTQGFIPVTSYRSCFDCPNRSIIVCKIKFKSLPQVHFQTRAPPASLWFMLSYKSIRNCSNGNTEGLNSLTVQNCSWTWLKWRMIGEWRKQLFYDWSRGQVQEMEMWVSSVFSELQYLLLPVATTSRSMCTMQFPTFCTFNRSGRVQSVQFSSEKHHLQQISQSNLVCLHPERKLISSVFSPDKDWRHSSPYHVMRIAWDRLRRDTAIKTRYSCILWQELEIEFV